MSSQSQPDPSGAAWAPTPETAVFAGNSLEEAIDEARAYFGPQAQVRAARRVRQGLRGRVRFEVLAAPAPPPPPPLLSESALDRVLAELVAAADAAPAAPARPAAPTASPSEVVDLTLAELLAAADESEATGAGSLARPAGEASGEDDFLTMVKAALRKVPLEDEAPAGTGPHPDPELLDAVAGLLPSPRTVEVIPDITAPAAPAIPALPGLPALPAAVTRKLLASMGRQETASWSLLALARAGVPSEVIDQLPPLDADDDEGWMSALRDAIEAVVPPPGRLGDDVTAVVNGVGVSGAAMIMRAGIAGICPGTLTYGGRALPATAAELALAVRTCVLS